MSVLQIAVIVGGVLGLLLSYEMPIYTARIFGVEPSLRHIIDAAFKDSFPSMVLFSVLYMIVGFILWASPAFLVFSYFYPDYSPKISRWMGRKLWFISFVIAPIRLSAIRKYDAASSEIITRVKLKKLYVEEFEDQFPSFRQFYSYYKWVNDKRGLDPTMPLNKAFSASLDIIEDAEIMLGLRGHYGSGELAERYKILAKQVHPDVAGPNDLMRRVTEARDIIRKRRGWR